MYAYNQLNQAPAVAASNVGTSTPLTTVVCPLRTADVKAMTTDLTAEKNARDTARRLFYKVHKE